MKLKDQCVSYDLAKQMKMLGVKQNGIFTWIVASKDGEPATSPLIQLRHGIETYDDTEVHDGWRLNGWSAFTVAELGEMLPNGVHAASSKDESGWYMQAISPIEKWTKMYPCKNEADARAKMLIHLIENKIITVEALK